jgi:hypothetical protein
VIFVVIPGIYTYLYLASDDVRGLFYSAIIQVIIQNLWIIVFTPIIGVSAIAIIWVVYIPFFLVQDMYAKRVHGIGMDGKHVVHSLLLGFAFAIGMYYLVEFLEFIMTTLPFFGILEAAMIGFFVIPVWYLYIATGTLLRLVNSTDLENIESVLRIVPPAWWVSKPLVSRLQRYAENIESKGSFEESTPEPQTV